MNNMSTSSGKKLKIMPGVYLIIPVSVDREKKAAQCRYDQIYNIRDHKQLLPPEQPALLPHEEHDSLIHHKSRRNKGAYKIAPEAENI